MFGVILFFRIFAGTKQITIMKELKGTKTEKNLQEAFAGESMARNKYTYWASKAKKDGYAMISSLHSKMMPIRLMRRPAT